MLALPNFKRDLAVYVKAKERVGEPIKVILATYNRVGEGLLSGLAFTENATLHLYQGRLASYLSPERTGELAFGGGGEIPPFNLTSAETEEFFREVKAGLVRQGVALDRPALFVVYGGEEEKFRMALDLINEISNLTRSFGKGSLAKFYLLTCNCDLAKKAGVAQALQAEGRLECVVYNPAGACGGFEDLQAIAETVLNVVPD